MVYPRACGGTIYIDTNIPDESGLSPHLRGNHIRFRMLQNTERSIPAPAGEPEGSATHSISVPGLSPRLRGNPPVAVQAVLVPGSIPAPAGEPPTKTTDAASKTVYPRACGGTACCRTNRQNVEVYPRACGGTEVPEAGIYEVQGLSPRLRGNLRSIWPGQQRNRSIPAPAGEPDLGQLCGAKDRVYPRACGGTCSTMVISYSREGLSPRLRGNPPQPALALRVPGSIPAPAGEPTLPAECCEWRAVYPRACGGTILPCTKAKTISGLSPRLRGNRRGDPVQIHLRGSIPAPAGEPLQNPAWHPRRRVYPRACGGI